MVKKIFLLLGMLSLITLSTLAQENQQEEKKEPIQFVHANTLYSTQKTGKNIQILKGQVIVSHKQTTIYCDSAYIDRKANKMDGYGDVRLIRIEKTDTMLLYCDTLHYDANKEIAYFENNVRLIEDTTTLVTSQLKYDFKKDIAYYDKGGKIFTSTDTLTSLKAYYLHKDTAVAFSGNVIMKSGKYRIYTDSLYHDMYKRISYFYGKTHIIGDSVDLYCSGGSFDHKRQKANINTGARINFKEQVVTADSINYNHHTGLAVAEGNVRIVDTTQKYTLTGSRAHMNERRKRFFMAGDAVLTQYRQKDTFWLRSDTIFSYTDTVVEEQDTFAFRKVLAYHKVKGFQRGLQVKADSAVYSLLDSTLFLYSQPVIWSDSIQITGDFMELLTLNGDPYKLIVKGDAFIVEHTLDNKFNQIKGKNIELRFKHRELREVDIEQEAQAIYYLFQDSVLVGVNKMACDTIKIFIHNKKVASILALGATSGQLIPPAKLTPKDEQLDGFQWLWYFRPLKPEDIYIWSKKD